MKLQGVEFKKLSAKQKEIYNFQKAAAVLAEYGFNCIKLADDWQGADFLAYHKDGDTTLKVQLKSRVGIYEKYMGKKIWMIFPIEGVWYLVPHDKLLSLAPRKWKESESWLKHGAFSTPRPSLELRNELRPYALEAVRGRAPREALGETVTGARKSGSPHPSTEND